MTDAAPIDADLVRRLVADQFPEWAGLPVTPVAKAGWDNDTYRLGDALSVRLPRYERWVGQVEREQTWLPRLAPQLPLPVPEPLAQGEPAEGYPYPWSVLRWLDGEPATTAAVTDPRRVALDLAALPRRAAADRRRRRPAAAVEQRLPRLRARRPARLAGAWRRASPA